MGLSILLNLMMITDNSQAWWLAGPCQ